MIVLQYFDISCMNFNQIKIFICVAESGSFSDAARKLNYSQSMVSKTISSLENDLGIQLVLRVKSQNMLTDAGTSLYRDFKRLLKDAEDSVARAFEVQKSAEATMRVGVIDCVTSREKLAYLILKLCNRNQIRLMYNEQRIRELLQQAQEKKLDMIVTAAIDRDTLIQYGYQVRLFYRTKAAVFVRTHALFGRDKIELSDLANDKFIMLSPENSPNYLKFFVDTCRRYGFEPDVSANVANTHSYRMNILSGQGIVFADEHTDIEHKDIKKFILDDISSDMIIAWLDHPSDLNERFVDELIMNYHEGME